MSYSTCREVASSLGWWHQTQVSPVVSWFYQRWNTFVALTSNNLGGEGGEKFKSLDQCCFKFQAKIISLTMTQPIEYSGWWWVAYGVRGAIWLCRGGCVLTTFIIIALEKLAWYNTKLMSVWRVMSYLAYGGHDVSSVLTLFRICITTDDKVQDLLNVKW